MEFLKVKNLWKPHKSKAENLDPEDGMSPDAELQADNANGSPKAVASDSALDLEEDEDDDDLITNEIKRRLKELRRSNFMVLIPEESCPEEDETCSSEWRESEVEDGYPWCGFDALYGKYCERMLFFDKMSAQKLLNAGEFSSWLRHGDLSIHPQRKSSSSWLNDDFLTALFIEILNGVLIQVVEHGRICYSFVIQSFFFSSINNWVSWINLKIPRKMLANEGFFSEIMFAIIDAELDYPCCSLKRGISSPIFSSQVIFLVAC